MDEAVQQSGVSVPWGLLGLAAVLLIVRALLPRRVLSRDPDAVVRRRAGLPETRAEWLLRIYLREPAPTCWGVNCVRPIRKGHPVCECGYEFTLCRECLRPALRWWRWGLKGLFFVPKHGAKIILPGGAGEAVTKLVDGIEDGGENIKALAEEFREGWEPSIERLSCERCGKPFHPS